MRCSGSGPIGRVGSDPGADRGRHRQGADAVHDRQGGERGGRGLAEQQEGRGDKAASPKAREATQGRRDAGFVEPQLCSLVERAPPRAGWAHEVKFDGYRLQLRVEDGKATLRTRKGLDWTEKFAAIAKQAAKLPDCMIDGEAWRSMPMARPDFSACRRRCRRARPTT